MEIRRRLLMQIGGKPELWNKAIITVPSNMTTAGDIYAWLTSDGVLPIFSNIFFAIRDDADITTWTENDFIETSWINGQASTFNLCRARSPQSTGRYLQNRNPINNPSDTMFAYQGETFTVFYQ